MRCVAHSLQFFLLCGRKEHVVEDQPVARRVRVQRQIGRRVADLVLRILRIVPAEEGPGALAVLAVDVLDPRRARLVGQHGDAGLERLAGERRGEPVEVRNHLAVVLHQHRGHRIDLGAEVEQGEGAERLAAVGRVDLVAVDVGVRPASSGSAPAARSERRAPGPTASARRHSGSIGRAVGVRRGDVHPVGRQRQVERLGGGAHREQEPAPLARTPRWPRPRPASRPAPRGSPAAAPWPGSAPPCPPARATPA